MSHYERGDLVLLKWTGDIFEVVDILDHGTLRIAGTELQFVVGENCVEPACDEQKEHWE